MQLVKIDSNLIQFIVDQPTIHGKEFINSLDSFTDFCNKGIKGLINKEVHFIGCQHGDDNEMFPTEPEVIQQTILSQRLVYKLVLQIKPQIIGVEGFFGDEFTPKNQAMELLKLQGKHRPSISEILAVSAKLSNDEQSNSIIKVWKQLKNNVIFIGAEHPNLTSLCLKVIQNMEKMVHLNYPVNLIKEAKSNLDLLQSLRGYYMLARLNKFMEIHKLNKGLIAMGSEHCEHEVKDTVNFYRPDKWLIYDAIPDNVSVIKS